MSFGVFLPEASDSPFFSCLILVKIVITLIHYVAPLYITSCTLFYNNIRRGHCAAAPQSLLQQQTALALTSSK